MGSLHVKLDLDQYKIGVPIVIPVGLCWLTCGAWYKRMLEVNSVELYVMAAECMVESGLSSLYMSQLVCLHHVHSPSHA